MEQAQIKLQLRAAGGDSVQLLATDFVRQMQSLLSALKHTDLSVTLGTKPSIEYRVVGLTQNSPATVVLEAVSLPEDGPDPISVVAAFFGGLRDVITRGKAPEFLSREVFENLREMLAPIGDTVSGGFLEYGGERIDLDVATKKAIDKVVETDEVSFGTVSGMVESVNIHNNANIFRLYPIIGADRITCHFPDSIREHVKDSLGSYVTIFADLRYKWRARFPYEAYVKDLEIMPSDDGLPTFDQLRGLAKDATDGLPSVEFVRKVRDATKPSKDLR